MLIDMGVLHGYFSSPIPSSWGEWVLRDFHLIEVESSIISCIITVQYTHDLFLYSPDRGPLVSYLQAFPNRHRCVHTERVCLAVFSGVLAVAVRSSTGSLQYFIAGCDRRDDAVAEYSVQICGRR